nr:hypothetical protein BaRGS_025629 [Batillaria attramentaria]
MEMVHVEMLCKLISYDPFQQFGNEAKSVDVVCSWENGNPPVTARLLDRHGVEMEGSIYSSGQIRYMFPAVSCQDAGLIRCTITQFESWSENTKTGESVPVIVGTLVGVIAGIIVIVIIVVNIIGTSTLFDRWSENIKTGESVPVIVGTLVGVIAGVILIIIIVVNIIGRIGEFVVRFSHLSQWRNRKWRHHPFPLPDATRMQIVRRKWPDAVVYADIDV